jgi:TatA/E family protein of Tat protein translocase
MPFNIGPGELIIVLVIALIVVGPGKLPDVGAALGKSIKEFRKAATDVKESTSLDAPAPAPAVAAAATAAPVATAAATVPAPATSIPTAPPAPNVIAGEAAPNTIAAAEPNTIAAAPVAEDPAPEPEPVESPDEQHATTA